MALPLLIPLVVGTGGGVWLTKKWNSVFGSSTAPIMQGSNIAATSSSVSPLKIAMWLGIAFLAVNLWDKFKKVVK
jgi:hypothetical protein